MNRREFLKSSALGAVAIAGLGFSAAAPRRDILWFSLDDGRADAVGCYGKPWAKTPNIDRIAARGVRFETAIVQCPVCVPSRRSMKTGHYVHEVGPPAMGTAPETPGSYVDSARMAAFDTAPNLLDRFTEAGLKPVNVGKIHGFGRSFDHRGDAPALFGVGGELTPYFKKRFGEDSPLLEQERLFTKGHHWQIGGVLDLPPEETLTWRLGDQAVKVAEALAAQESPFFLRVSFHAPHVACNVPTEYYVDPATIDLPLPSDEELESKPDFERGPLTIYGEAELTRKEIGNCRGTYYGMVALVDVQVGRIMGALRKAGRLENTVIAFTSDQGFQLGEHGLWKKRLFYEANVRVPFLLSAPGLLPEGAVVDEPVEMIDFLPTLMEISGLEPPRGIRGRSLVPLIEGRVDTWREACFSEIDHSQSMYDELRQGSGRRIMVRTESWKLIYFMDDRVDDKDGALYHLAGDPGETVNRYHDPECRAVVARLEQLAEAWAAGRA